MNRRNVLCVCLLSFLAPSAMARQPQDVAIKPARQALTAASGDGHGNSSGKGFALIAAHKPVHTAIGADH